MSAILAAVVNDSAIEQVGVHCWGYGGVLFAITTRGNSANVVAAAKRHAIGFAFVFNRSVADTLADGQEPGDLNFKV